MLSHSAYQFTIFALYFLFKIDIFVGMSMTTKTNSFYNRLREQLEESADWPSNYLFKFILPSDDEKKATVRSVFANHPVQITERNSSKNTYVSISIEGVFESPDQIISKYKAVAQIEGVIQL
jgi:putative lipoic acid-binding regulatory protein